MLWDASWNERRFEVRKNQQGQVSVPDGSRCRCKNARLMLDAKDIRLMFEERDMCGQTAGITLGVFVM